jgi:acetyl-CoA synthetase
VKSVIGPIAVPKAVLIVDKLPKTRSGKIMRRLLRAIFITTLEDEASVEEIRKAYEELRVQI